MIRDITEAAFVLGQYKTYQVSISLIEAAIGFDWGSLRDNDPLNGGDEAVFGLSVRPVLGASSLVL
jgi:hypothetical protein